MHGFDTPGTMVRPGCCDLTLAVKNWWHTKNQLPGRREKEKGRKYVLTMKGTRKPPGQKNTLLNVSIPSVPWTSNKSDIVQLATVGTVLQHANIIAC